MRVVITGSSGGIGRALAERLLTRGHELFGWARSDQSAFAAGHPGFSFEHCDVSNWDQVRVAAERLAARWPALDALICCAGTQGEIGPALAADPRRWSETVRTNIDGCYFPLRALRRLMGNAGHRAKIVCFSGGGATKARPNFSAYGSAKTAIVRLVESLAAEEGSAAIDINAIAPGAIFTQMTEELLARGPEKSGAAEYEAALKLSQSGDAPMQKALDCIEWLLSPASDGISGRLISAPWDPWQDFTSRKEALVNSEVCLLRRISP